MRKSTFFWLVLAAFCGTTLFHTSQKVHGEQEKLAALAAAIGKEEESLRVLNAEWGYLNQPRRLEKLAKTYLNLAPLKGSQFIRLEEIPLRPTASETMATPEKVNTTEESLTVAVADAPKNVIKIRRPPVPKKQPPTETPATTSTAAHTRGFGDVMKGLGID